jgi:glycosyltransferase involved in cell wall biosynthesis
MRDFKTRDFTTGAFQRYPDLTGRRQAEGGARLRGDLLRQGPGPRVTLLTVCWNADKTLEQMLASVAAQSYGNFEHLVVDGASTDRTVEILQAHEHQLDYFVSEPDQGLYFAMNKALELAQGDYILFLNSDDWYEPDTIEKLVAFQAESGADFVSSLANYVDESGTFERVQPYSPFDAGVEFRMPLRHETMLVPDWMYNAVGGYDTRYRIIADRVFTAGLFWRGYRHATLHEPLLNFRTTGTSSVDLDKLYSERARALAERFPGLSPQALRDLADLERITPARLLEISRITRAADFRAAAIDYALDREAQGHKAWQDIDVNAFSPVLRQRPVSKTGARAARDTLAKSARPKVSVILPIYNAEDMLAECLDSVLAQSLPDFELICINDQTPDGSQAIVEAYATRDRRVTPRINEVNVGLGASRNRGIALARGEYIFHIDPDDVIPPDALQKLVEIADQQGSEMVRGAFLHEQMFQGKAPQSTRKGLPEGAPPILNTTLRDHPEFLQSTEGHWSYLYRADFAKRVFYPEDLKMGQDSIFLTHALVTARSISVIPDVIYHYRANANSAMNVYNFRKYMDEIEWRARAWQVLTGAGLPDLGAHLLCSYWNLPFFEALNGRFDAVQKTRFWRRLRQVFARAGNEDLSKTANPALRQIMAEKLGHFARLPSVSGEDQPLRIEVIATSDHGGAGGAARRSVDGLRAAGHQARLHCLFSKSEAPHIGVCSGWGQNDTVSPPV